jgi:hypothetical protein
MAKKKKKEITEKKEKNELIEQMNEHTDGLEDTGLDDLMIPRMKLLQPNSEPVLENKEFDAGTYLNTVTNETEESFVFLPLRFSKYIMEREPAPKGQLFGPVMNTYRPGDEREFPHIRGLFSPQGYYAQSKEDQKRLTLIYTMFGVNINDVIDEAKDIAKLTPEDVSDPGKLCVVNFINTNLQSCKKLITQAKFTKKKLWRTVFNMEVKLKKNDQGTWYVMNPQLMGTLQDDNPALKGVNELLVAFEDLSTARYAEEETEEIGEEIDSDNM